MGIIRNIYAWAASKLAADELNIDCEHRPVGACADCVGLHTADRYA